MNQPHFVLIHSAWLGAWSWKFVRAHLADMSLESTAVELPCHGGDTTRPEDATLDAYVERARDALPASGPAIVVGHSFGGVVASQLAERAPEAIAALVYIAAPLLPSGVSFMEAASQLESDALSNLRYGDGETTINIAPEHVHDALAADVSAQAFAAIAARAVPEPVAPLLAPVELTGERFGSVPRYYIQTSNDRALPLEAQRQMVAAVGVEKSYTIDASHGVVFSRPAKVADILAEVARDGR